jgi:membrane protease YdiL (CAAX protease family)
LLPGLILLLSKKLEIKQALRLNRLKLNNILIIPWIMIFAVPLAGIFNVINLWVVNSIFGKTNVTQLPVAKSPVELLAGIFIIAAAPAICEETLFRGVIMRGLEKTGPVRSILITAFLFGLMHADFQKLLGTFVLGVLIGFLVYRTGSLYSGMLAHFTNNAFAVVVSFAAGKLMEAFEKSGLYGKYPGIANGDIFSAFKDMPVQELMFSLFFYFLVFVFCAAVFIVLMVVFMKNTSEVVSERGKIAKTRMPAGILLAIPGILLLGFVYINQGMKFLQIHNKTIETIFSLITGKPPG